MAKKILSAVLCGILIFASLIPAFAQTGEKYIVLNDDTHVLASTSYFSQTVFELEKGRYVYVTEKSGDFLKVTVPSAGVSGWVYAPLLEFAGTVSGSQTITGISVSKKPDKLVYIEDEEAFDPSGMKVVAEKPDKTTVEISGYKIYSPDMNTPGQKTVYIGFSPADSPLTVFTASFEITINKVPLKSISLEAAPTKSLDSYIEGQPLDLSGIKIRAKYTDGRQDKIFTYDDIINDKDFIITGCHSESYGKKLVVGTHNLELYYKYGDISLPLKVTARQKSIASFEMTAPPNNLTVYKKDVIPDLTGIKLTATYDNGEAVDVLPSECKITCDPSKFILGGGNKMTIEYEGKQVTVNFTFALLEKTGIKLKLPKVLSFTLGEPIDLSDFAVYYVFSSGETELTENYTRTPINPLMTGTQTVTVKCDNFSATFNIIINPYYQRGDINGDGRIEAADARLALRNAVGLIKLGGVQLTGADADRDGKITSADARLILRASVGLEDFLKDLKNTTV